MRKTKHRLTLVAALCWAAGFWIFFGADDGGGTLGGLVLFAIGIALLIITNRTPD